jgi:pseudouridine synthase
LFASFHVGVSISSLRMRLQRALANAGVASRRAAEKLILDGRVAVNGTVVRELGSQVDADHDALSVDGSPVKARRKLYVALHKPRGCVCTRRDPQGRRTVADYLPAEWDNLYPVGRLDFETEGLLFLTNDGDFCLRLTHPRFGVVKRYLASVDGQVDARVLQALTRGVRHEGELLRALKARALHTSQGHALVELELDEGRYHEVRRLFAAQGIEVVHLQRVQVGPIKLGQLPVGRWRTLNAGEVRSLMEPAPARSGGGKARATPAAVPRARGDRARRPRD